MSGCLIYFDLNQHRCIYLCICFSTYLKLSTTIGYVLSTKVKQSKCEKNARETFHISRYNQYMKFVFIQYVPEIAKFLHRFSSQNLSHD